MNKNAFQMNTMWKEREGKKSINPGNFLLLLKKLRYNSHTIFTLIKYTIQWTSVYSQSCATNTTIQFQNTTQSKKKCHTHQQSLTIPPSSSPYQSLIYFCSLWIYLFQKFHIHGILFCIGFFLSTMFSKFIHVTIFHSF